MIIMMIIMIMTITKVKNNNYYNYDDKSNTGVITLLSLLMWRNATTTLHGSFIILYTIHYTSRMVITMTLNPMFKIILLVSEQWASIDYLIQPRQPKVTATVSCKLVFAIDVLTIARILYY